LAKPGWTGCANSYRGISTLTDASFDEQPDFGREGTKFQIIHELAHYWDYKVSSFLAPISNDLTCLKSLDYAIFTLGDPGPTWAGRQNIAESWAEAVTAYVYPQYIDGLRKARPDLERSDRLTFRQSLYIRLQIAAL
jgi:hypothetical protein